MEIPNYPSNSFKSKEMTKDVEKHEVKKVISGNAKKKSKIFDNFFAEDLKQIKTYIVTDILVPALKDLISNTISKGTDMLLFGESRDIQKKPGLYGNVSYVNYNNLSKRPTSTNYRTGFYTDVVVESRSDAEEIVNQMSDMLDTYQMVSVADLYECAGLKTEFTDNKYGWTSLSSVSINRTRDGYVIKMPKPRPLD